MQLVQSQSFALINRVSRFAQQSSLWLAANAKNLLLLVVLFLLGFSLLIGSLTYAHTAVHSMTSVHSYIADNGLGSGENPPPGNTW